MNEQAFKVITKYVVTVDKDEVLTRFSENYIDILKDTLAEGNDSFYNAVRRFEHELKRAKTEGLNTLFSEGYTYMLLDEKQMEYVEKYFQNKKNNEEIVIEVVDNIGVVVERVGERKISF